MLMDLESPPKSKKREKFEKVVDIPQKIPLKYGQL
jgi:hypothetical protein